MDYLLASSWIRSWTAAKEVGPLEPRIKQEAGVVSWLDGGGSRGCCVIGQKLEI